MAISNHPVSQELLNNNYEYKRLFQEYKQIESKIAEEDAHNFRPSGLVKSLKREKLNIRDKMQAIESSIN